MPPMYENLDIQALQDIVEKPLELDVPPPAMEDQNELRNMPIKELELMLQEPELMLPKNEWMQREIVDLIREQKGSDYVAKLIRETRLEDELWLVYATSREKEEDGKTTAQLAKDWLRERENPLADVLPDTVETFIADPNGVFYIELSDQVIYHMLEFDLVLDQYIYGWMEEPFICKALNGVWAHKEVYGDIVEINFTEIWCETGQCIIKTDHPLARSIGGTVEDIFTIK
jgi:hypothetical protein